MSVGKNMKGCIADDDFAAWEVNRLGQPHHDDMRIDGCRAQLAHMGPFLSFIGSFPKHAMPVSATEVLKFFDEYAQGDEITVEIDTPVEMFVFSGSVAQFKALFRHAPPPDADDYEDGADDTEYREDLENWIAKAREKTAARAMLGRGGRDDVWQDKDEDFSESFSVYNNPQKKRRRR